MTDPELDRVYSLLCSQLSAAGEAGSLRILSRFALLATLEIADAARVEALLTRAAEGLVARPEGASS